jgi:hypothetical protein
VTPTEDPALWKSLIGAALLVARLAAGCRSPAPTSSGGAPQPLPGHRIPPGYGPAQR